MNHARVRATLAAALTTLALSAGTGSAAAAAWAPPATFDGTDVQTAMNARGDIGLAWQIDNRTLGVGYRPAGGTLTSSTVAFAEDVSTPRVAINAGGDVAAGAVGNAAMHAQVRHPDGTLGPPITFTPGNGTIGGLDLDRIAMDDADEVLAAWTTYVSGTSSLSWALAAPDGTVTSSGSAGTPAGSTFSVAMNGAGDGAVGWTKFVGSHASAMVSTRAPGGGFAAPVDVSGDPTPDSSVSQVAINPRGDLAVAISAYTGMAGRTRVVSRPHGGLLTAATDASPAGVNAQYPAIGADGAGNLVVTWSTGSAASVRTGVLAQPFTSAITQFSPASSPAIVAPSPNGATTILYGVQDGSSTRVAAVSRAPGGAFGAPATVGTEIYGLYGNIPYGSAGADDAGDVATAWTTSSARFRLAIYDASPPELRGLSIPAGATAGGAAVAFSVAPWDAFSAAGTPHWDFGDGAGADGASVAHAFGTAGTYRVTVSATDAAGNASSASGTVTVAAAAAPSVPAGPAAPAARTRAPCRVPSLRNLTRTTAKRKLAAAHCALGRVTTPKKYKKSRGLVVRSQSRRSGAKAAAGTKVNVTLGPRPKPKKHRKHKAQH